MTNEIIPTWNRYIHKEQVAIYQNNLNTALLLFERKGFHFVENVEKVIWESGAATFYKVVLKEGLDINNVFTIDRFRIYKPNLDIEKIKDTVEVYILDHNWAGQFTLSLKKLAIHNQERNLIKFELDFTADNLENIPDSLYSQEEGNKSLEFLIDSIKLNFRGLIGLWDRTKIKHDSAKPTVIISFNQVFTKNENTIELKEIIIKELRKIFTVKLINDGNIQISNKTIEVEI